MAKNKTGNPLGSKAYFDFEDNVVGLDEALNDPAKKTWQDRFGRDRKTYSEIERLADPDTALAAAEQAENAAQTAIAANRTIFRATRAALLAAMQGPPAQQNETPGKVTNDPAHTEVSPVNGDYVWRSGALVWSDVQTLSQADVSPVKTAYDKANLAGGLITGQLDGYVLPSLLRNIRPEDPINLFNVDKRIDGMNIGAEGVLIPNPSYYVSDVMILDPGTYSFSSSSGAGRLITRWSHSGAYSGSATTTGNSFTLTGEPQYVRISQRYDDIAPNKLMLVAGSLPAYYVPHASHSVLFRDGANKPNQFAALDSEGFIKSRPRSYSAGSGENLFDIAAASINEVLKNDGTTAQDIRFFTTDFIKCSQGDIFRWTTGSPAGNRVVVGYDANKNFVGYSNFTSTYTVGNVSFRYIKITNRMREVPPERYMLTRNASLPIEYVPYLTQLVESPVNKNKLGGYAGLDIDGKIPVDLLPAAVNGHWVGKSFAMIGDSICYGFVPRNAPGYPGRLRPWGDFVKERLGFVEYFNHGISGSTVGAKSDGGNNPMTRRFQIMDDADCIGFMGGVNDLRQTIPLGTFPDRADTTFYGALHTLCEGLIDKYIVAPGTSIGKTKTIFAMTPIKNTTNDGATLRVELEPYCDAIKEVCAYYSIPVLDMYNESGMNPHILRTVQGVEAGYTGLYNPYITDGTHPTQEGHEIMAHVISGFLNRIRS